MPERAPSAVETTTLVFQADGRVRGVYSDSIPWGDLGRIVAMPRASHVEFDPVAQGWLARDARTGTIIAQGPCRAAVLAAEHAHYVAVLRDGAAA